MTLSTTGAASSGLVYLTLTGVDASGHTFTEQGSGVLLSDDEVLTAAHLVYNDDGSLRTTGMAAVGYNKGTALALSGVNGVQVEAKQNYTTVTGMEHDFAVVHLSTPVTNGTIFSLGSDLSSGTFNVSGYPVGTAGALDTKTEALSVASGTTIYTGGALNDGTANPDGSSGGSIYQIINGAPTAYGVISADLASDTSKGFFKQLTAADVAEIRSWVAAADGGTATTTAVSGTLAASTAAAAGITATGATSATHSAPGFSTDIAAMLSADAADRSGPTGAVMADVAAAIAQACQDGGTLAQMSQDAASYLAANASYAKRATAYLAGLLSGTTGTWLGDAQRSADAMISGSVSNDPALKAAAAAGRTEGLGMGVSSTAATIDPASATLAGAIADGSAWDGTAQGFHRTDAAGHAGFLFGASHHHHG